MSKVRIAIVGVGNCASSLVQGLEYYKDADPQDRVPGLMHVELGGYHVHDVEVVAAFDVDAKKVGTDVAEAILSEPNNTIRFADVAHTGVKVNRGRTLDGLGTYYRDMITESELPEADVVQVLKDAEADVLVCYLPVGSEQAAKFYAQCAIDAGVGFVNCLPVFIASTPEWAKKFADAGVPIIGDDIKSQVGATITHRVLTKLFEDRGVKLNRTYQLNFGGNMDFMNMLERERLTSKKISKTQSVQSQLEKPLDKQQIHIGPSDHVPWLEDRKWAMIRLEGESFGGVPLSIEMKLEVWDSPNSAGIVIDAVRCAKLAMDRGVSGPLIGPSAYFMKSPPVQFSDEGAHDMVEEFILGTGEAADADWTAFFDEPDHGRLSPAGARAGVGSGYPWPVSRRNGWPAGSNIDPDVVLGLEVGLLRAERERIGDREREVAHLEIEMQHHLLRAFGRRPHRPHVVVGALEREVGDPVGRHDRAAVVGFVLDRPTQELRYEPAELRPVGSLQDDAPIVVPGFPRGRTIQLRPSAHRVSPPVSLERPAVAVTV